MRPDLKTMAVLAALGLAAYAAYAEDVTISTYYPSPYGSYKNLETTGATNLATGSGSSDRVGIGTTSPASKLNLSERTGTVHGATQGSLILDHENNAGASSIVFRSKVNRGSDYGFIQYQDAATVGGAGESAKLIIGTSNDYDDDVILQPSGNVGIGTTNPADKLHVVGTIRTSGGIRFPDNTLQTTAVTGVGFTTTVVQGPNSACQEDSVAVCPSGSILVGGGYQWLTSCGCSETYRFAVNNSPSGNGWVARMSCATCRAFAVCATPS